MLPQTKPHQPGLTPWPAHHNPGRRNTSPSHKRHDAMLKTSPHSQPSQPTHPSKATKTRPAKPARQATPTSKPARPATQPAEAASTVSQRSQTAQPASQPKPNQATLTRQPWEACSADSIFYRSKRRCYVLDTNVVLLHENKLFLLLCRNMHGAEARTRFLQAPQAQEHAC